MSRGGGYITDRRCPANPEHGVVHGMRAGGHYCPHQSHDHPIPTKNIWTDAEFEAAKSPTTPAETVTQSSNVKIAVPKSKRRRQR